MDNTNIQREVLQGLQKNEVETLIQNQIDNLSNQVSKSVDDATDVAHDLEKQVAELRDRLDFVENNLVRDHTTRLKHLEEKMRQVEVLARR